MSNITRMPVEDIPSFATAHACGWEMRAEGFTREETRERFERGKPELTHAALDGYDLYDRPDQQYE